MTLEKRAATMMESQRIGLETGLIAFYDIRAGNGSDRWCPRSLHGT